MTVENASQHLHTLTGHEAQLHQAALQGATVVMAAANLSDRGVRAHR